MATLRRRKNNWQAIIRLKNYPNIYKSFKQLKDARRWSSETEINIQREDAGIFYHQSICDPGVTHIFYLKW